MPNPQMVDIERFGIERLSPGVESDPLQVQSSAVAWGAILAGAAAAAALSLILLVLGTGLGLSSVSPWLNKGISASTFGVSTIVWVIFTQIVASGMGGYLAGRLRKRWIATPADEVYFRDTAHGFLAWAIASLVTAALLTSVIASIVGSGIHAGASVAEGIGTAGAATVATTAMAKSDNEGGAMGYFVDSLLRTDANAPAPAISDRRDALSASTAEQAPAEISRIFMNDLRMGTMPSEDIRYVGQVVARRTGLTQADAEQRVTEGFARMQATLREAETAARETADTARKATAYASLWLFISLLAGAFFASFAAIYGGRQRDFSPPA
jgi:hypothetical protein